MVGSKSGHTTYGTVAFSTKNYWYDLTNKVYIVDVDYATDGRSYRYVYGDYKDADGNQQNIIYPYVSAYETYLKENGVSSASATLISPEQLKTLGCDDTKWTCGPDLGKGALETPAPEWVYSTSYWTGSAYDANYVLNVRPNGNFIADFSYISSSFGVRPVITISTSEI